MLKTIRNKKLVVLILGLLLLVTIVGLVYFLVTKDNISPEDSEASAGFYKLGERINDKRQTSIILANSYRDLPINDPKPGALKIQCRGNNQSNEWSITQWINENSLCNSTTSNAGEFEGYDCSSSDSMKYETESSIVCYDKRNKNLTLGFDSSTQYNHGCTPSDAPLSDDNAPGGYGLALSWGEKKLLGLERGTNTIPLLDSVRVSFTAENKHFSGQNCPSGIPSDANDGKSYAFASFGVALTEVNPSTLGGEDVMFYQVEVYDNRVEIMDRDNLYLDCGFPNGEGNVSILAVDSIKSVYGKDPVMPGQGAKRYDINVLPQIKKYLKQCRGENVNMSNYRVLAFYMGTEMGNNSKLIMSYKNPKMILNHQHELAGKSVTKVPLRSFYCNSIKSHAYTTNDYEAVLLRKRGCTESDPQGYIYNERVAGSVPLYAMWDPNNTRYFYTTNGSEADLARNIGYVYSDPIGYISRSGNVSDSTKLYRVYCPANPDHYYTISSTEKDRVIRELGCRDEGFIGYAFKNN